MNRWNIPDWLERQIAERDRNCIYCGSEFAGSSGPRRSRRSWEHIINDVRIITPENIALCCIGCNASKGAKELTVWLESKYCATHGITRGKLSAVAQAALAHTNMPKPHL